ncbi:histone acetyltransferases subunit 3-domain-containing protein [Multifurca ochricompacta]|uniref:Histone acetyltransferases subunit 3-domain-containing protein n=1 Tax=Multifurca ochricompacta TaxID=376703 RepID=A0AAD4QN83_9AGAM|nr:histone acetyltransferases subunit 3-domain-containing protein [Multifurca ochricompacta]
MSSSLVQYPSVHPFRSHIVKNTTDGVPPTEELEALKSGLTELRQHTLERAKKADDDLRAIEESMRRLKEREKGKAKAVERTKREFTPLPVESNDGRGSSHSHSAAPTRFSSQPIAASSSRSSLDARKPALDDKKKKKKRKRDDDSDDDLESHSGKAHKPTPPPVQHHSQPFVSKAIKPTASLASIPQKPPSGPDFTPPQAAQFLQPKPPVPPPPIPGPSKPTDVMEDFSKAKQPSQVLVSTFYASIEPYLRPIREEDLGFLEYSGDEVEPFIMPRLGQHYSEQWEDEDISLYDSVLPSTQAIRANSSYGRPAPVPPVLRWDPATLNDDDLLVEERGHGPLTERLVSALLPIEDSVVWKGVKAAEEAMEGRHGVGVGTAAGRQVIVEDLERRIKDSLKYHKILETNPDFTDPVDDPIATALRQAQHELRVVVATNRARKARLLAIAKDRLGYQEYVEAREALDKNILALYMKLQKKDGPKVSKKKKSKSEANGVPPASAATSTIGTWPSAAGLGPDDENMLRVPEVLAQLVATRRQWVDSVGSVFDAMECEQPGAIYGLPEGSIYEGLDVEVSTLLECTDSCTNVERLDGVDKGKTRAGGEEMMDIDR